jgi:hypothetical protein
VTLAVGVTEGVLLGVTDGVTLAVGVNDGVTLAVLLGVTDGVLVGVGVTDAVGVGVTDGHTTKDSLIQSIHVPKYCVAITPPGPPKFTNVAH